MIIFNNKEYQNVKQNISYGKYHAREGEKKREGLAPFLSFKLDNTYIGIEMIYDIKWIEELKIDTVVDITKYITDITFEDEKGWLSLIYGEYNCLLSKIDADKITIELKYKGEEDNINFEIYIKENIKLEYEELSK